MLTKLLLRLDSPNRCTVMPPKRGPAPQSCKALSKKDLCTIICAQCEKKSPQKPCHRKNSERRPAGCRCAYCASDQCPTRTQPEIGTQISSTAASPSSSSHRKCRGTGRTVSVLEDRGADGKVLYGGDILDAHRKERQKRHKSYEQKKPKKDDKEAGSGSMIFYRTVRHFVTMLEHHILKHHNLPYRNTLCRHCTIKCNAVKCGTQTYDTLSPR